MMTQPIFMTPPIFQPAVFQSAAYPAAFYPGYTQTPIAYQTHYPSYQPPAPPALEINPLQGIRGPLAPEISKALVILAQTQNLPADEYALQQMGVNILFHSGQDALKVIRDKNIRVEFGDMGDSLAHAQWIRDQNLIMINQKYRGDLSKASLYAISEAIYHEAGHSALLGDDRSSLQEEIDCLALNTLAYRTHTATDQAYAQSASKSRLIADGVALYARLFFDPDPSKKALVNRVIEKYGVLPPDSPDHSIPVTPHQVPLADRVMRQLHLKNSPYA